MTGTIPPNVGVDLIVGVTMRAMGLSEVLSRNGRWPSNQVLAVGDWFKMGGIGAGSVATQVVNDGIAQGANGQLIGNSVGTNWMGVIKREVSIPGCPVDSTSPCPTGTEVRTMGRNRSVFDHLGPEAFRECRNVLQGGRAVPP